MNQQIEQQWIYVFVRTDIPVAQQAVQTAHAVYELARNANSTDDHPSFVFLECDNLGETMCKFSEYKTYPFYEPYNDWGLTAFAVGPVKQSDRLLFKEFKLWRR